jgi:ESAT-6 family protein
MSDAYTVDLERLDAVVQRIQTFDASVERRLADLNHRMAHIRTIWTGDASQAQAAAHDEWTAAAAELRHGLAALRGAAATAHANYQAAQTANVTMWRAVV